MPVVLTIVGWSVVLLFSQIAVHASLAAMRTGLPYNASPRDTENLQRGVVEGRAWRALRNFLETYPAFIALALALVLAQRVTPHAENGAWLWLGARALYVPAYLAGIPYVRTLIWAASIVGLVWMLSALMGWA